MVFASAERSWLSRCWVWSPEPLMMRPWSRKLLSEQLTAPKTSTSTQREPSPTSPVCPQTGNRNLLILNLQIKEKLDPSLPFIAERGPVLTSPWPRRSDGKSPRRRVLHRQPDSLDSVDSCSSVSSYSSSSHFQPSSSSSSATASTARRFRFHSKSPASPPQAQAQSLNASQASRSDSLDRSPTGEHEGPYDERPQFTSRGTFNPEKGKQKLRGAKNSTSRHSRDSGGHGRDPPDIPQPLVLYGSNEFMV